MVARRMLRRSRRRRVHVRSRARNVLATRFRGPGVPATRTVHHRFSHNFTIAGVAGALAGVPYKANSIYRPGYAASAFDAKGYDEMFRWYNAFIVVGSRITVKFCGIGNAAAIGVLQPVMVGVYLDTDITLPSTTYNGLIEAGRGVWRMFNNATDRTIIMKLNCSPRKYFNVKDMKDNHVNLGANAVSTDPAEVVNYAIWMQPFDQLIAQGVTGLVQIDYIVHWGDAIDFGRSVL